MSKSKVFHSFAELGAAMGIRKKEKSAEPATKRCRKCGGVMTQIGGTNVFECGGKTENGEPCRNMVFTAARSGT